MPVSSPWPLQADARRLLVPPAALQHLQQDALCRQLHPDAAGFYPAAQGHQMQRSQQEHDDYLLLFCSSGSGRVQCPPQPAFTLNEGTGCLISPGIAHRYHADDSHPWSLYWVHFNGTAVAQHVRDLPAGQALTLHQRAALQQDFRELFQALAQALSKGLWQAACMRLAAIVSTFCIDAQSRLPDASGFDPEPAQQLMRQRLSASVTLAELACCYALSRFHFATRYRQSTGLAPLQHFQHMKMQKAAQLLDSSHLDIADIAALCGYQDTRYFSRVFGRIMGTSPSRYRRHRRG